MAQPDYSQQPFLLTLDMRMSSGKFSFSMLALHTRQADISLDVFSVGAIVAFNKSQAMVES
jgi:hypothetical protein